MGRVPAHRRRSVLVAQRREGEQPAPVAGATWIPLGHGRFTLVDVVDVQLLAQHTWCLSKGGYPRTNIARRAVLMHKLLLPHAPLVDHRNADKLDNRRMNLRVATKSQNAANHAKVLPRSNTIGFRGLVRVGSGWVARLKVAGRTRHLGTAATREGAAQLYDDAAFLAFGTFATLNRPSQD